MTLAISPSSKLSLRCLGLFLAPCAAVCLEGALSAVMGSDGVDLEGGGRLARVLLISSCLGSSDFWFATVALVLCGLGDDLLAA